MIFPRLDFTSSWWLSSSPLWRLIGTITLFACLSSCDFNNDDRSSFNMMFENLDTIDTRVLGTNNLNRYQGSYHINVNQECRYVFTLKFKHDTNHPVGTSGFKDNCLPASTQKASDGKGYHDQTRKNWIKFPEYVQKAIGFNHLSIDWKPCGLPPLGFRQARYDINFYMVSPEYRTFMTCNEVTNIKPVTCHLNQTSYVGRRMFSLPTLAKSPNKLANMPRTFAPANAKPAAYKHDGMISYGRETQSAVPTSVNQWVHPGKFQMSSYDGNVISWRGLIPYTWFADDLGKSYELNEFYVFQTLPQLPDIWNTTYTRADDLITFIIKGDAGICRNEFLEAKEQHKTGS